jgi:hypothetical protein
VPQFLLRGFTDDPDGRTVCVFNLPRRTDFRNVPLRHQAYRNNLYGSDGKTEAKFAEIESVASSCINLLIKGTCPDALPPNELESLCAFIMTQIARTPTGLANIRAAMEGTIKEAFRDDPRLQWHLGHALPEGNNPFDFLLSIAIELANHLFDLRIALVESSGEMPFVLGDHPTSIVNPLLQYHRWPGGKSGVGNSGTAILLPVSSRHLLVVYDPTFYRALKQASDQDVRKVNFLEMCASSELVFHSEKSIVDTLLMLETESRAFRQSDKYVSSTYVQTETKQGKGRSELIVSRGVDPPVMSDFTFLPFTHQAIVFRPGPSMDVSRPYIRRLTSISGRDRPRRYSLK